MLEYTGPARKRMLPIEAKRAKGKTIARARQGRWLGPMWISRTLLLFAATALGGCVSLQWTSSETQFSEASESAPICEYAWQRGEVLFRAENVYSYSWGTPEAFGYSEVTAGVDELLSQCRAGDAAKSATLSVYFLEHANKAVSLGSATMVTLSAYTLGTMPIPAWRSYVACVEINPLGGPRRTAIAEGSVTTMQNVWGFERTDDERAVRGKVMQDLARQAWHKVWLQPPGEPGENCRRRLEAMIGRVETPENYRYESACSLADRGIAEYQSRVGNVLYNESDKSRRNLIRAYVWYALAAKGNNQLAIDRVEILTRMLSPEELKEAQQNLEDWKPGQCMNDLADSLVKQP
jgi:hypothetical protein